MTNLAKWVKIIVFLASQIKQLTLQIDNFIIKLLVLNF